MPYPRNVETALNVEKIIRDNGAIPATIAILGGKLKVGLTNEEIEYLGKAENVIKTSRRDIPFIVSKKLDGATTCASTMILANLAGIKVFATGGIGGVHRGVEETFDISADLEELAKTNVEVVCAGCKSILDIGLILEYLETHGVPVVANPIPSEFAMDYDEITTAIENAVKESDEKGIRGKESNPFLLSKVKDITKGKSLYANIELVYNNAKVGARLAVELSKLQ